MHHASLVTRHDSAEEWQNDLREAAQAPAKTRTAGSANAAALDAKKALEDRGVQLQVCGGALRGVPETL